MRRAALEVLDVGVWTFGLVGAAALAASYGVQGLAVSVGSIVLLGVTGRAAIGTIDRMADRLED